VALVVGLACGLQRPLEQGLGLGGLALFDQVQGEGVIAVGGFAMVLSEGLAVDGQGLLVQGPGLRVFFLPGQGAGHVVQGDPHGRVVLTQQLREQGQRLALPGLGLDEAPGRRKLSPHGAQALGPQTSARSFAGAFAQRFHSSAWKRASVSCQCLGPCHFSRRATTSRAF
jgi:hypothetical protein